MNCKFCSVSCQKAGRQKNGTQKFYCKVCKKYQQPTYKYQGCNGDTDSMIQSLLCEGMGIRSIGRILKVCNNTVLSRIRSIAKLCKAPVVSGIHHEYEMDELRTYTGNRKNECWLTYCIIRDSRQVMAFTVGRRTKEELGKITSHILGAAPRSVYTDRLPVYRSLLPSAIHRAGSYCTNRIERFNLDLRTHVKRLSRKTICYSKNRDMLEACIRIYFWRFNQYSKLFQVPATAGPSMQHT